MISFPIPHIPSAFLQILVELESGVKDTLTTEKPATKRMAPVKECEMAGLVYP